MHLPALGNCPQAFLRYLTHWCPLQVNLSVDPELGTIYSVAVPVKRVKPQARVPLDQEADPDGVVLQVGWLLDEAQSCSAVHLNFIGWWQAAVRRHWRTRA